MAYAIGIDIDGNQHKFELKYTNTIHCQCKKLIYLTIYDENNQLVYLDCFRNELESLIIHGGKNIKGIYCIFNNLKELDLSMCENLKILYCDFILENDLILPNHKLQEIYYVEKTY